jgi:hypothetical protein
VTLARWIRICIELKSWIRIRIETNTDSQAQHWFHSYMYYMEVASADKEHHAIHLMQLFLRIREHELVINLEKCVFGPSSVPDL